MNSNFTHFIDFWETEVFIIQGKTRQGLINACKQLSSFLSDNSRLNLKDLAFSLNCPLMNSQYRLAVVSGSLSDLNKKLDHAIKRLEDANCEKIKDRSGIYFFEEPLSRKGSVAFIFPGEGAQYVNMLYDLCLHFPDVRTCFDLADRTFTDEKCDILPSQLLFLPQVDGTLSDSRNEQALWEIKLAVTSVFTGDYALWTLFDHLGIRPQAVAGHSSGEFAALVAAGAMPVEGSDELVRLGRDLVSFDALTGKKEFGSKLMTVGVGDPSLIETVVDNSMGDIYIAMDNCPHQVILCGTEKVIAQAYDQFRSKGGICEILPYDRPYHTPLYRSVSDQFHAFFEKRKIVAPHTTLYSCATAEPYPVEPSKIRQLAVDQWHRPVRFRQTIEAMYDAGVRIFVEVGPRGNLTSFVEDILAKRPYLAVPSNLTSRSGITQINHTVGLLAAHGVLMRLDYLYELRSPVHIQFDIAKKITETSNDLRHAFLLKTELPKQQIAKNSRIINSLRQKEPSTPDISLDAFEQHETFATTATDHGGSIGNDNARDMVMREYLNTMEDFLEKQQDFVTSCIQKSGKKSSINQ